jgi:hypothetical protein
MTMWPDDNDRIDAAIDAVARHMTEGAPGAGLTARVLARIRERRPVWRSPWVLSPLALAAVLLVAVALNHVWLANRGDTRAREAQSELSGRGGNGQSAARQTAPVGAAQPREPGPLVQADASRPPASSFVPQRPAAERNHGEKPDSRRTLSPAAATTIMSDIDTLALPALDVDSIAVDRLARPEPLVVQRLEITSIALAPIGEGDRP